LELDVTNESIEYPYSVKKILNKLTEW
jgi:hypothetical protein